MRGSFMLVGGVLMTFASLTSVQAQPNPIQGTPESLFPYAAPNEVQIINGVPCRTVLVGGSNMRVPVECARWINDRVPVMARAVLHPIGTDDD